MIGSVLINSRIASGGMEELRGMIRGCPEAMSLPDAGHFVQEYGKAIAERALEHFRLG
jgi:hypothetical protein